MPRARLTVFPGFTHVQLDQDDGCAFDVLRQVVGDPATGAISPAWRDPSLPFVLPDGAVGAVQPS